MPLKPLRLALCSPELISLQRALRDEPTNATYIIQKQIATRLRDRGHDITLIAEDVPGEYVSTSDFNSFNVARLTWSGSFWFSILMKTVWLLQRSMRIPYLSFFSNLRLYDACIQWLSGYDLVYERNGLYRNGIAMACKHLNLPYVLYVEADEILEYEYMGKPITGLLLWRAKKTFQYNLHAADCIICVSNPLKTHLVNVWNVSEEKIVVFPNGVDAQQFQPYPEERDNVRKSLGVNSNPAILFVGNFYEWHDVATLLDAFAQVLVSHPDARLILVGEGTMRGAMEERAAKLGVADAVRFTGLLPHTDVPRYMAAAEIAVVPYPVMTHDLWLSPLKLFEYMASGKAIIASAVGQLLDIVKDDQNSLLVPPGDIDALAFSLRRLLDDPNLRQRLGYQARKDAIQKHSWEKYILRLEDVFSNVINANNIPQILD